MQIKNLILKEACKASNRILYISTSTKQIIIQKHIYVHTNQVKI
jgi:hypothetical protein